MRQTPPSYITLGSTWNNGPADAVAVRGADRVQLGDHVLVLAFPQCVALLTQAAYRCV
jgi:hypothetical protein